MSIFITSDHHFGHKNILSHQSGTRQYSCLQEMHKDYVKKWNLQVANNDIVYHLGDFSFYAPEKYFFRLNGKIKLIAGNHDKWARKKKYKENVLYSKSNYPIEFLDLIYSLNYNKEKIVLCHYPIFSWPSKFRGSFHFYGHCHKNINLGEKTLHVGVDDTNGYLWELNDALKQTRSTKSVR